MRPSVRDILVSIIDVAEARLRPENGPLDPSVICDFSHISMGAREALDMISGPYTGRAQRELSENIERNEQTSG